MTTNLGLSPVEQERWQRDGFFVRERAFSAREVEELRAAGESVVGASHGPPRPARARAI